MNRGIDGACLQSTAGGVETLEAGASLADAPGRDAVLDAIRRHGLASGCLIGTYERADTSVRMTIAHEEGVPVSMPLQTV